MASKVLEILIKAKDAASSVFNDVAKNSTDSAKKAEKEQEGILDRWAKKAKENRKDKKVSGEGALESVLKSGGGLTDFALDSLNMGLPAMVTDRVGESLAKVTDRIVEMRNQLREGKSNWADFAQGALEAMPIIGGFAKAGANINELFTHNKENSANDEFAASATNLANNALLRHATEMKELRKAMGRDEVSLDVRLNLIGKEGFAAEIVKLTGEQSEILVAAEEKKNDTLKRMMLERNADIAAVLAERAKITEKGSIKVAVAMAVLAKGKFGSLDNLKRAIEDEAGPLQAKINELNSKGAADRAEFEAKSNEEILRLWSVQQAELQGMQQKAGERTNRMLQKYADDQTSIAEETNSILLRMNRQFFQADIAEIQAHGNRKKAEIDRQLKEDLKAASPEDAERIKKDAWLRQWAIDNEGSAKIAAARKADGEKLNNSLESIQEKSLEMQVQYSATASERLAAQRVLERGRILRDAREQAKAVADIQNDPNATAAQKAAAKRALTEAGKAAGAQYQKAVYGSAEAQSVLQGQETHRLTGAVLAAQEKDDKTNSLISISQEALDVQKDTLAAINQILQSGMILQSSGNQ